MLSIAAIGLSLMTAAASAQDGTAAPEVSTSARPAGTAVTARLNVSETFTDNVGQSATKRSEAVTVVSPGLKLQSGTGLVRGYMDYALTSRLYAQGTSSSAVTHNLAALGTVEAVRDRVGMDVAASAGLQTVSASGVQGNSGLTAGANQAENFTYSLSPYLKGRLSEAITFDARATQSGSRNGGAAAGSDVSSRKISVGVQGKAPGGRLGWTASASTRSDAFSAGRSTESDQYQLGLSYALTPQFNLSTSGRPLVVASNTPVWCVA
jgi:uncharacterized protein (PEP-CTERM system associated)